MTMEKWDIKFLRRLSAVEKRQGYDKFYELLDDEIDEEMLEKESRSLPDRQVSSSSRPPLSLEDKGFAKNELVSMGNGVSTAEVGILDWTPVRPSTVTFTDLSGQIVRDDGNGNLVGDCPVMGEINYAAGTYSFSWATPPNDKVVVDYEYEIYAVSPKPRLAENPLKPDSRALETARVKAMEALALATLDRTVGYDRSGASRDVSIGAVPLKPEVTEAAPKKETPPVLGIRKRRITFEEH